MEFNSNAFIHSFINAHLAMSMYLIWQREFTAKVSIKNTSPNVQRLQYIPEYNYNNNTDVLTQYIGGRSWREQGHTTLGPKKTLAGLSCSQKKYQIYNIQCTLCRYL